MATAFCYGICALAGYLLGSISFAVLFSKLLHKDDVRTKGSGNAGMTNMLRSYGKLPAILTFLGDFFKGFGAVMLARWLVSISAAGTDLTIAMYIAMLGAVIGHFYPVFFKFKGGKSVAVTCGCILGINLPVIAIMGILFLVVVLLTKIVSLSSIIMLTSFPLITALYNLFMQRPLWPATGFAVLVAAMVIAKHHQNIKRLLNGTEHKFGKKKAAE